MVYQKSGYERAVEQREKQIYGYAGQVANLILKNETGYEDGLMHPKDVEMLKKYINELGIMDEVDDNLPWFMAQVNGQIFEKLPEASD